MQLFFRPLALSDVHDDGRQKRRCAFSDTRDETNTDIRPDHITVLAAVTFLDSPISPAPFQAFCYQCFGRGAVLFIGHFRNGETSEFFLRIAEHSLPS